VLLTEKNSGPGEENLLEMLLEKNVLSRAQVEVAKIDIAATGLNPIDVLLARKWITEQTLSEFVGAKSTPASASESAQNSRDATTPVSSNSNISNASKNAGNSSNPTSSTNSGSSGSSSGSGNSGSPEKIYQENLKKYRQLMAQIMGEAD
jgi:hypothetical protein